MGVRVPPFALALLAVQTGLCALLLIVRATSVVRIGRWWETTGLEGIHIAIIRRVALGGPVYQDINTDSTISLYNYGFYRMYAAIEAAVPRAIELLALRGFTLVSALACAVALAVMVSRRLPNMPSRRRALVALAIAFPAVLGPFAAWMVFSARPDMTAFALEFAGLALVERARGRVLQFALAGVAFGLAIALKQNAGSALLAATVWLALNRSALPMLVVWLGVAASVVIGVWTSGPFYLQHVLIAPATSHLDGREWLKTVAGIVLVGGPAFAGSLLCGAWRRRDEPAAGVPMTWPMLLGIAIALPQLARFGAGRNYLIGAFAFASAIVWLTALTAADRRRRRIAVAAVVLQTALLAAYFVPGHPGALRLNPPSPQLMAVYADALKAELAPPYYTDDSTMAFLWPVDEVAFEATDSTVYPGYVGAGHVSMTVEDRIAACRFGTLVLDRSPLIDFAVTHGYRVRETFDNGRAWLTRTPRCGEAGSAAGR
jgi:hypothetical protein